MEVKLGDIIETEIIKVYNGLSDGVAINMSLTVHRESGHRITVMHDGVTLLRGTLPDDKVVSK